jgi:hypothetical protein
VRPTEGSRATHVVGADCNVRQRIHNNEIECFSPAAVLQPSSRASPRGDHLFLPWGIFIMPTFTSKRRPAPKPRAPRPINHAVLEKRSYKLGKRALSLSALIGAPVIIETVVPCPCCGERVPFRAIMDGTAKTKTALLESAACGCELTRH